MRTYAEETKHSNLRVHLVRPGVVQTDMLSLAYPGGFQGKGLKQPHDLIEPFLDLCDPLKIFDVFVDLK